jgi:RNA polymerase sigma-70 factor (ECF subfamily)
MHVSANMSALPAQPRTANSPNPVAVTDEELVRRLKSGDTQAGQMLVERHFQPLIRYLQRLTDSEHAAEELHQQTWLSVLEHIDRFDSRATAGGFKAWLFRIATNKANDLWRSRGRERTAREGLKLVADSEFRDAGAGIESSEQVLKLRRAIDQLPEPQKQVLLMRYYGGLKFAEIAGMLGCPLNTALGRMHKAVLKLRQAMAEP